jgi:hypothetical protein
MLLWTFVDWFLCYLVLCMVRLIVLRNHYIIPVGRPNDYLAGEDIIIILRLNETHLIFLFFCTGLVRGMQRSNIVENMIGMIILTVLCKH